MEAVVYIYIYIVDDQGLYVGIIGHLGGHDFGWDLGLLVRGRE